MGLLKILWLWEQSNNMTKQWHNTNIERKPYRRFNPSLKQQISQTYRTWFFIVALLSLTFGILIIGCSSGIKVYYDGIKDELFHLWVGIPMVVLGVLAFVCASFKKKWMVIFLLLLSFLMVLITVSGAISAGYYYWKDGWRRARYSLRADRCQVTNNQCTCSDMTTMPAIMNSCDDMDSVIDLIICQIFFSLCGFVISVKALFLSFMSICCAPWVYSEWYDPGYDPDFPKIIPQPAKTQKKQESGQYTYSYGEQTTYYN